MVTESTQLASSSETDLQHCQHVCLWTFRTFSVSGANRLVIPVTYDGVLSIRDARGTQLDRSKVGSFLGVAGTNGIGEGELTLTLDPDIRMLSRALVSILNICLLITTIEAIARPRLRSH